MRIVSLTSLIAVLLLVSACGKKSPLQIPEEQQPAAQTSMQMQQMQLATSFHALRLQDTK